MESIRKEEEIYGSWKGETHPIISIRCQCYNQVDYIEDAIIGFISQKTTVPFEILIHDDASTDGTADIVRDYAARYPRLIKPIIQTENQYSKGVKVGSINVERAQGRYLALCEGDDYWIDEYKLQKQYEILEKHKDIDLVFTAAKRLNREGEFINSLAYGKKHRIFSIAQVILKEGGFIPSPSIFYRKEIHGYRKIYPYVNTAIGGDYFNQIFGALNGGAYYLPDETAVYRVGAKSSWTSMLTTHRRINHIATSDYVLKCLGRDIPRINIWIQLARIKRRFKLFIRLVFLFEFKEALKVLTTI